MTTEIPVTQARDELAELINRVAYGHERIILTRHSKPVACLVLPEDLQQLEQGSQEMIRLTRPTRSTSGHDLGQVALALGHLPGDSISQHGLVMYVAERDDQE